LFREAAPAALGCDSCRALPPHLHVLDPLVDDLCKSRLFCRDVFLVAEGGRCPSVTSHAINASGSVIVTASVLSRFFAPKCRMICTHFKTSPGYLD